MLETLTFPTVYRTEHELSHRTRRAVVHMRPEQPLRSLLQLTLLRRPPFRVHAQGDLLPQPSWSPAEGHGPISPAHRPPHRGIRSCVLTAFGTHCLPSRAGQGRGARRRPAQKARVPSRFCPDPLPGFPQVTRPSASGTSLRRGPAEASVFTF